MAKWGARLSKKGYYASQLKRAAHLLFFKHHLKPGAKGWELRKQLGADYPKALALLNRHLEKLDLQVKTVFEGERPSNKQDSASMDRARFYVTLRGDLTPKETKMMGWRIDDIAGLAVTVSTIIAKKGKASRVEVEKLLKGKLPGWRVGANLDRYIKSGYVDEDDNGQLFLDWRTRAEIDEKTLVDLLLAK